MNIWTSWLAVVAVFAVSVGGAYGQDGLKVIQSPTFWIVGQWTRIMVETPADCGQLEVTCPEQLTLLDQWPPKPGDTTQRFYFRATGPLASGEIGFRAGNYSLTMPVRVMSWGQVLTERYEVAINNRDSVAPFDPKEDKPIMPRLFPLNGLDEHKQGISVLTPQDLQAIRQSVDLRNSANQRLPLTEDLEGLFYRLAETTIPRAVYMNSPSTGCPICGLKVFEGRDAFYPWVLDPENRPYKVGCPECGNWFPSNDFAAGDMTSGQFADDGWGYFDAQGRQYSFIGYYILQTYRGGDSRTYEYSHYYLATGDQRWGRATALVLTRIAEQYLNLALNMNQRNHVAQSALFRGTVPPQNTPEVMAWSPGGFYVDGIWSISLENTYGEALERIWDYFNVQDPVLLAFLQQNGHPEMQTMQHVRNFIETGYFRTVAQGVLDDSFSANGPGEPAMAMRLARFLNTPRSIDLVRWAFDNPHKGLRYYLRNWFFVDGAAYESPGYNNGHYGSMTGIASLLTQLVSLRPEQYAEVGFPLLTEDPKFKSMFDHNINLSLISRTYANVGDDGNLAQTDPLPLKPGASLAPQTWVSALRMFPDEPNYAKALWDSQTNAPVAILTDPALRARVTEVVQREGPYLDLPSQVLPGFGQVTLRSGEGEDQRAMWMRFGTMYGHFQHDSLTIGLEALRRTFLPEQGYYRGEEHRTEWDMNWALHYSGRILGVPGEELSDWGVQSYTNASLRLFGDGDWARMATAARRFYRDAPPPQLTELTDDISQERTIALVDLDPQHSYAVSIFRLDGGTDHYLSFHGPRGTAQSTGLQLAQQGGTLAGPDVPYGIKWDSPWSSQNPHLMMFPFLYDVQRGRPTAPWQVTWSLERYPQVQLRLHSVTAPGPEVNLARGKPAGGGAPYELQWVVQHNSGAAPLATQFAEVMEYYEGTPLITEVRPLTVQTADTGSQQPVAFQVVAGNRVDTIIHSANPDVPVTTSNGITMQGSLGVWSEQNGNFQRAFLTNGSLLQKGDQSLTAPAREWTGTIQSVDFADKTLVVAPAPPQPELLVGRYVRITNPQGNDVTHHIVAAEPLAGGVQLTLELDPRIGEGPVQSAQEDGISCEFSLFFTSGLYYRGKTLSNEDNSATYVINGVRGPRSYINMQAHPTVSREVLAQEFVDKTNDGLALFLIYDYGVGDTITVPTVISSP